MSGHESGSPVVDATGHGEALKPIGAEQETSGGGFVDQVGAGGTPGIRRRVGWIAAMAAVAWFTTLIVEYRFGLFPDQRTGGAVIATQLVFLTGMASWAAALVLMLRGRIVTGKFAVFALGWQCAGLVGLVAMGLLTLNSGNQDSPMFPLAGLSMVAGGFLTGIALFAGRALPGRARWVGLAYSALILAFLFGGVPPTFAAESMLPLAWFVVGVAMVVTTRQGDRAGPGA